MSLEWTGGKEVLHSSGKVTTMTVRRTAQFLNGEEEERREERREGGRGEKEEGERKGEEGGGERGRSEEKGKREGKKSILHYETSSSKPLSCNNPIWLQM